MSAPFPETSRTRETKIRRDSRGRWFDDEVPLTHPKLTRAFDRWLEPTEDGRYCLRNDINWAYVQVEGPPLFVRRIDVDGGSGDGRPAVTVTVSGGTSEDLDLSTLRQDRDGILYCHVGTLAARFDREAMLQLADYLAEDEEGPYIEVAGQRTRVPTVDDPLLRP